MTFKRLLRNWQKRMLVELLERYWLVELVH